MIDHTIIEKSFETLRAQMDAYQRAAADYQTQKDNLAFQIATATMDETINGKNAEIRDAQARQLFGEEFESLDNITHEMKDCEYAVNLSKIDIDHIKTRLRLAEVLMRTGV